MINTKGVAQSYFSDLAAKGNVLGNKFCWDIRHCFELAELNDRAVNLEHITPDHIPRNSGTLYFVANFFST